MKNTDTPSIERLKELLAKASPSLIGGNLKPDVISDLLRRGAETQVPRARNIGATNFEADGLLITELLNNFHAILRALATLAGEGVERIEAVTKAIMFADCGSTEDWQDNTNLGEAALAAITAHRTEAFEKVESYIYGLECKALADIRPPEVQAALEALSLPTTEIRREAKPDKVREIVDLWFAPWGAAKGALWEDLSGDKPFDPNVALEMIRDALPSPPSRPSFDKWDYARAVLKDSEGEGRHP